MEYLCCERLAYYGMSTNLVKYMKTRLGQGNSVATNNVTNSCRSSARSWLTPTWTIASFMIIYITVSTLPEGLATTASSCLSAQ